jgi:hypothetical protein
LIRLGLFFSPFAVVIVVVVVVVVIVAAIIIFAVIDVALKEDDVDADIEDGATPVLDR